jgi:hypothetical protein
MTGTWKSVPGSSGAGHVASDLALQNQSGYACQISGFPDVTLHDANGNQLPTTVTHFSPSMVELVTLQPGGWAHSELRYSSDIPGPGEPQTGPCEPTAAYALLRLQYSSVPIRVALTPPTPVCEKGAIVAKAFASGPSSPAGG